MSRGCSIGLASWPGLREGYGIVERDQHVVDVLVVLGVVLDHSEGHLDLGLSLLLLVHWLSLLGIIGELIDIC